MANELEYALSKLEEMVILETTFSNHLIYSLRGAKEISFPEGWKKYVLKELAHESKNSFVIGPFGSDLVVSDYKKTGNPVVFVRDVKPNVYQWISNVYVKENKFNSLSAHKVMSGDIVITKMGLPPAVAAVYPDGAKPGIITADIIRLRVNPKLVNPYFLASTINSRFFRQQVKMITAGQTRPKLTLRDFKELVVYLPSLDVQNKLASIFTQFKSVELKSQKKSQILLSDLI